MKKLKVEIKNKASNYKIFVGENILVQIEKLFDASKYSAIHFITDSNLEALHLNTIWTLVQKAYPGMPISSSIFEAGEEQKNLETVYEIYEDMIESKLDRKILIINLGGGVVTDLGGFVASTYQRGVDFVNISTTIEGMVDASVGGKTGVNLGKKKNYVGMFAQPKAIFMDLRLLETLPEREFIAGFAEIIKHGLIADKKYFEFVTSKHPLDFNSKELESIIFGSCEIKANVVSKDEKEGGLRKILNFGHTVGHALESYSFSTSGRLFHGEAVAIGMVAEAFISTQLGWISESEFENTRKLIEKAGLPISYPGFDMEKVSELLLSDKKNQAGKIKWSLLKKLGKCGFDIEVPASIVDEALGVVN